MNISSNSKTAHPKREQLLKTGRELFWKFGFRRVTVEEICKEAGVSKMTFYKFFSNKIDLVKTIMSDMVDESLVKYRSFMESDLPYTEKVFRMIQMKREGTEAMSNEFFRDYTSLDDPEMMKYLEEMASTSIQIFQEDLLKAQRKGDIRKDVKVEFILYFVNHMSEMIQDEKLQGLYNTPQELVLEVINFMFYGLLSREKK